MVRRNGSTVYTPQWSATLFRWGVHVRRRGEFYPGARWRAYRVAVFSKPASRHTWTGVRLIDVSIRDTETGAGKPLRPAWRFWVGFKVGRTWSEYHYGSGHD